MYNILVVDDDKEIVESIDIYLKNEGYKIYKAYNGLDALDIIANEKIHLILMDILMKYTRKYGRNKVLMRKIP